MERIIPLRDMVLTEVVDPSKTRGGVLLPAQVDAEGPRRCKVLAVGELVSKVRPGDLVILDGKMGYGLKKNLGLVPEGAIYAIVENADEDLTVDEPEAKVTLQ